VDVPEAEQISGATDAHPRTQILGSDGLKEGRDVDGARALSIGREAQVHVRVPGIERRKVVIGRRVFAERRVKRRVWKNPFGRLAAGRLFLSLRPDKSRAAHAERPEKQGASRKRSAAHRGPTRIDHRSSVLLPNCTSNLHFYG